MTRQRSVPAAPAAALPELDLGGASWPELLASPQKAAVEKILPAYIKKRRWFGGKARRISGLRLSGAIPLGDASMPLALLDVSYSSGSPQTYLLPLVWREEGAVPGPVKKSPGAPIARLVLSGRRGLLYDAAYDEAFHSAFLSVFSGGKLPRCGRDGLAVEKNAPLLKAALGRGGPPRKSRVLGGEQSNTAIVYGSSYFLKLFRRLEKGVNPDVEIGARLTRGGAFRGMPPFMGAVSLRRAGKLYGTIGLLQGYSPSRGDSWRYAQAQVSAYYGRVLSGRYAGPAPDRAGKLIGAACLEMMSLLGRRTAEMHLALSGAGRDPDFRPEPFSRRYRDSVYRSMLGLASASLRLLSRKIGDLPAAAKPGARALLGDRQAVARAFLAIRDGGISAMKIRTHGDYHLGQVLFTGRDFVIIDFEGEPAKPLGERRLKHCALRDVAGMLRSFHYAAWAPFFLPGKAPAGELRLLEPWAELWYSYVSQAFLRAYFKAAAGAGFLPAGPEETGALLKAFLMEKAVYELSYELNNRPDWVEIPLKGLLRAVADGAAVTPRTVPPAGGKKCRR